MTFTSMFFRVAACCAVSLVTQNAFAQQAASKQENKAGILGYLDPKTGAFKPAIRGPVQDLEEAAAAATAPHTGKYVFKLTITVSSSIPTSQPIYCGASASTFDISSTGTIGNTYAEEASTTASRSGSTATCTVNIPYSWVLANSASDSVELGISVQSYSSSSQLVGRTSIQSLGSFKVPASGSTSTQTISVTI